MADQGDLDRARQALSRKDMAETHRWADTYLRAHPGHVDAATMMARALEGDNLGQAVTVLRQAIDDNKDLAAKLNLACELMPCAERLGRVAAGLPPLHLLNIREFPFHFCDADMAALRGLWAQRKPGDPTLLGNAPVVEFLLGNLRAADDALQQIASAAPKKRVPGPYATVRYAPEFYETLKQINLGGLPQVQVLRQAQFATPHVLFVGCDIGYFKAFAIPMLRSLAAQSPGADAHLHLMVVEGQSGMQIPSMDLNLHITYEVIHKGLDSPMYYHAMRLVRLYQFIEDRTLWMVDADALVNKDPKALYAKLEGAIGIRICPGRAQPWNLFSAGLVAASPASKDYFRLVAAYLARFMSEGNFTWGMDQMALYGVYQYLDAKPTLTLWGPEEFAQDQYRDNAVFWFTAGGLKKEYMEGTAPIPPHHAPYWDLFRRYAT